MFIFYNMAKFADDEAASDAEFRSKHLNPDRVARKLKNSMIRQYKQVADREESKDLRENDKLKELAKEYYLRSLNWAHEEYMKARDKVSSAQNQLENDASLFPDITERETYRRNEDELDAVDRNAHAVQVENDRVRLETRKIKAHVQAGMLIQKEFPGIVYDPKWNRGK
jgi:hypothetical protein